MTADDLRDIIARLNEACRVDAFGPCRAVACKRCTAQVAIGALMRVADIIEWEAQVQAGAKEDPEGL